jgi:hypothetical protein
MSLAGWLLATLRGRPCAVGEPDLDLLGVRHDVQGGEHGSARADHDARAEGHPGFRRRPGAATLRRHGDERRADGAIGGRGVGRGRALLLLRLLEAGLHRAVDVGPAERGGAIVGGPPHRHRGQHAGNDGDGHPRPN